MFIHYRVVITITNYSQSNDETIHFNSMTILQHNNIANIDEHKENNQLPETLKSVVK